MVGFSPNKGGVESYIVNITDQLEKLGFEIVFELPEMIIDGKIWKRPANRHNFIKYYFFWKRFFSENRFDVLYLNTCDIVSIDDLMFAKAAGIPIRIIHSHSTGNQQAVERRLNIIHQLMEKHNHKIIDRYATHLFACSKEAGEWMFDDRPFEIIKNGIDLSKYAYSDQSRNKLRREFELGDAIVIAIIGRLTSVKNPLFAVRVIEELSKTGLNLRAVFLGEGEQRAQVETAVREAALETIVSFIGAVDNVNEWLSAADVLLMPSLFEGLPFVLVEAQASGLPCVVSDAVSTEANITGNIHYVGLNEPVDAWSECILNAAKEKRQRNTSILIDAGYSIEDTANKVSDIIKSKFH